MKRRPTQRKAAPVKVTHSDGSVEVVSQSAITGRPEPGERRKKKPVRKEGRRSTRNKRLNELGFKSFDAYLRSRLWVDKKTEYRNSQLSQRCFVCGDPEYRLYHTNFRNLGCESLVADVVPLCEICHHAIHELLRECGQGTNPKMLRTAHLRYRDLYVSTLRKRGIRDNTFAREVPGAPFLQVPKGFSNGTHTQPAKKPASEYREYIRSPQWRAKRRLALQRDDYRCQDCGAHFSTRALQVHHLTYAHFRNEPLNDLITLCAPCHKKTHEGAL